MSTKRGRAVSAHTCASSPTWRMENAHLYASSNSWSSRGPLAPPSNFASSARTASRSLANSSLVAVARGSTAVMASVPGLRSTSCAIYVAGVDRDPFPHLLAPGRIGSLTLRNRILMCPIGDSLANEDGTVSERQLSYFEARARGGAALLLVGSVAVSYPAGSYSAHQVAA